MRLSKSITILLTWTFLVACSNFGELFRFEGSVVEESINIKTYSGKEYTSGANNAGLMNTSPSRDLKENKKNVDSIIKDSSEYLKCADSSLRFKIYRRWKGKLKSTSCEWIARKNSNSRCRIVGVRETCPFTCETCSLHIDSPLQIKIDIDGELTVQTCEWVAVEKSRCEIPGVSDACRETCSLTTKILMSFFQSTGGSQWKNTENIWGPPSDPCSWYGVKCSGGEVIKISLADNNLIGYLDSDIAQLSELTALNLFDNSLSGPIPSEIGQMTKLNSLELDRNALTGTIPTELGELSQLTEFDLDRNALTGTIPPEIGQLSQLRRLDLDRNVLTGTIPGAIGQLKVLRYLRLHKNKLTGSMPLEICDLNTYWVTADSNIELCA